MREKRGSVYKAVWHFDDPDDAARAVNDITKGLIEGVLSAKAAAVLAREIMAEDLIIRVQNKIWSNNSIVTGRLWKSIDRDPENLNPDLEISYYTPVDVGTNVEYAPYVEARKPFLHNTYEEQKEAIFSMIARYVKDEVGQ